MPNIFHEIVVSVQPCNQFCDIFHVTIVRKVKPSMENMWVPAMVELINCSFHDSLKSETSKMVVCCVNSGFLWSLKNSYFLLFFEALKSLKFAKLYP